MGEYFKNTQTQKISTGLKSEYSILDSRTLCIKELDFAQKLRTSVLEDNLRELSCFFNFPNLSRNSYPSSELIHG